MLLSKKESSEKKPLLGGLYQRYSSEEDESKAEKKPEIQEEDVMNMKQVIKELKMDNILMIVFLILVLLSELILVYRLYTISKQSDFVIMHLNSKPLPKYPILLVDSTFDDSKLKLPFDAQVFETHAIPPMFGV